MQRRVYCVGLRKHVEADIDDIVPITGKRGTKYQCVGKYSENGKDYVVKSWVPKADYEALHGPVVDIAAAEEFIGADVEAAEPLAADPVADSPVAEDSSEPLEVAPADQSYFLSESVVLSAIKEMAAEDDDIVREHLITHGSNADIYCLSCDMLEGDCPCDEFIEISPETITYDCISCGEEIDDEDGHELVGEFQEKCCLPCFKTAFGAENRQPPWSATNPKPNRRWECGECDAKGFIAGEECTTCDGAGYWNIPSPRCATCDSDIEWTDGAECDVCDAWYCNTHIKDDGDCMVCSNQDMQFHAEQTFEAQQKDRKDEISEKAALNLITNSYGVKRIVSGPTYYRFVAGTSSKFLMFAVVERNNGTYQAVNVYGRRGASYPTLWTSDIYPTQMQAERASKAKQNKKSRKGYVFLDAEEFTAFMAEHFNSETSDCWNSNCENSTFSKCVGCGDSICDECFWVQEHQGGGEAFDSQVGLMCCPECYDENVDVKYRVLNSSESKDNYMSESPLDESPVDEDPLTADPSDLGGPEDFSSDATIDLEDGEITIHEKGAKSGSKKKLLLGVILVAGLAAAYQNSDAVLSFFEGLKGDDDIDAVVGCMDETANNYDPAATEDDGSCTYDEDPEPTA